MMLNLCCRRRSVSPPRKMKVLALLLTPHSGFELLSSCLYSHLRLRILVWF
jgi:hypothetical protein